MARWHHPYIVYRLSDTDGIQDNLMSAVIVYSGLYGIPDSCSLPPPLNTIEEQPTAKGEFQTSILKQALPWRNDN